MTHKCKIYSELNFISLKVIILTSTMLNAGWRVHYSNKLVLISSFSWLYCIEEWKFLNCFLWYSGITNNKYQQCMRKRLRGFFFSHFMNNFCEYDKFKSNTKYVFICVSWNIERFKCCLYSFNYNLWPFLYEISIIWFDSHILY